ncbi:unnamed protein product [Leuciscus chuanchicus]
MAQRDELMTAILEFYTFMLHSSNELVAHPTVFEEQFLKTDAQITAADIVELFKPHFSSPRGSHKRRQETRTIAFWRDWLLEVEGGDAAPISLPDILIFATGLERVPAMGFQPQPELSFLHEGINKLLKFTQVYPLSRVYSVKRTSTLSGQLKPLDAIDHLFDSFIQLRIRDVCEAATQR